MSEENCISRRVTQTSYRAPTMSKSSVSWKDLRIILDKDIVQNYRIDNNSSSNNAAKKNLKQMKLTHAFKSNNALDIGTSNQNEIDVVEKRHYSVTVHSINRFSLKDQIQTSINNGNQSDRAVKTEPTETQSADEAYVNDSRGFIENNDLDIGEEFKYSDFLSRAIDPQEYASNLQIAQKPQEKVKPTRPEKSLAEKKPHRPTFQCDQCGLKSTHKRDLQNHIESKHSQLHDESGFITCVKCNKKYTTYVWFQYHERICGTKIYCPCQFCQKKLVYSKMKWHLVNQHAEDFGKKNLDDILKWCKTKRIREAAPIQKKTKLYKKLFIKNSELNKLVKIFCSKCDISLEIDKWKPMDQCLKCKTALKLECRKCKKTYNNQLSAIEHVKRLCKYKGNKVTFKKNKKTSEFIEDQQTNNSINSPQRKKRMRQFEIRSTDKMILNENRDVDDDLDIGEEFKYSEFLSSSENVQMNIVNKAAIVLGIDGKKKKAARKETIKRFECDYCGYRTKQKTSIESHIENKHSELHDGNGFHTCARCDKKYRTLARFHNHKRICGTQFYFPCKFCSKLFTASGLLKMHVIAVHEQKFDAKKINEILQWSKSKAVRKASNQKRFINALLPMKKELFRSYFDLNKQQKLVKMFCSKCNVTSERERGKSKIQCLKCDTALTFQCQMCKKTYNRKPSLLSHIRWYCKEKEGTFDNDADKMVSDIQEEEQAPNNSHSKNVYASPMPKGSLPYKEKIKYIYCNDCDYKAKAKTKLLHHIRFHHIEAHSKKGLIICPKCRKDFKFSRGCKVHQLVCSVSFDYKCKFCKFTAKESSNVKCHIKLVHADKIEGKNLTDIFNEILKERKNMKEKYEAAKSKKLLIENSDLSECFDLYKVIKMICHKCHVVSDRIKYQRVKDCSKCEKLLEYQCQRCGQSFDKYPSTWKHVRNSCPLLKKK